MVGVVMSETTVSPARHNPVLAPSILAANHARLVDGIHQIAADGLQWVHLDIMDGHFVPNLSFGPQTVKDLRAENASLFFDTHLMLDNPHRYIDAFVEAGSQNVTIHIEPDYPVADTLAAIRKLGCGCGIALNPHTPVDALLPHLATVDLVLVMTVQPGFGGQAFRAEQVDKIRHLHQLRSQHNLSYRLEVDGGIDAHTARLCREAGADTFVAGTAYFRADDRQKFIQHIEEREAL